MNTIPYDHDPKSSGTPTKKSGVYYNNKGEIKSGVMIRCA